MSAYNIKTLNDKEDIHLCGVYKIYCSRHPEVFYIGSTSVSQGKKYKCGFYKRMAGHIYSFKKNTHHSGTLQSMVNKFGLNSIVMEIIEICDSETCLEREDYYIKSLTPICNSTSSAFDSTGFKHSPKSLELMSKKRIGRRLTAMQRKSISDGKKGVTPKNIQILRSSEVIEKAHAKLRGRKQASEKYFSAIRTPVIQYAKSGNELNRFISIKEANEKTGINPAAISLASSGKRLTAGGFKWAIAMGVSASKFKEELNEIE
jgi:group I intron endonuclease